MRKLIICIIVMLFVLCGCSSSNKAMNEEAFDSGTMTESWGSNGDYSDNYEKEVIETNRKLIKTYNYSIQTIDFDNYINSIKNTVDELGGYFQNSDINGNHYNYQSNRDANFTIRIPSEKSNAFINKISEYECAVIVRQNEFAEDVTANYIDVEAHISALQVQENSLLSLMEKAEDIEDIIVIESKLSEVRYEIERYQRQLKNYDLLISYATFEIYVSEVTRVTPVEEKGMFEEIYSQIMYSIEDITEFVKNTIIFVLGNIIYISIYGLLIFIVYKFIKRYIRIKKFKHINKE